jgi:hypothetical protein
MELSSFIGGCIAVLVVFYAVNRFAAWCNSKLTPEERAANAAEVRRLERHMAPNPWAFSDKENEQLWPMIEWARARNFILGDLERDAVVRNFMYRHFILTEADVDLLESHGAPVEYLREKMNGKA